MPRLRQWFVHWIWYQALLVDAPSAVYASLVVPFLFPDTPKPLVWPLWIAKYNGFAVNLCVTYLLLSVMKNLKSAIRGTRAVGHFKVLEHRLAVPQLPLHWSHRAYTWRMTLCALLHTVVHTVFTHPLRIEYDDDTHDKQYYEMPLSVESMLNGTALPEPADLPWTERLAVLAQSIWADTYTWTGYALLLTLLGPIVATGLRLSRYASRHFFVLTAHRVFAATTIPLFVLHHPWYGWSVLWVLVFCCDALLGIWWTHRCVPVYVHRYPNNQLEDEQQENDVVDIGFRFPYSRLRGFQPGDFVRVNVPSISRWEWHDLTLMRTENCTPLSCVVHVTVRSVGRWTTALYTNVENEATRVLVKGPYGLSMYDPVMDTLIAAAGDRFGVADEAGLNCAARWLHITPPKRLILVCTGTAITHCLSILDSLIPLYYPNYRQSNLPHRIVLCWTVRTVFNLNFALIPLSRYQRQLADALIDDDLLLYEFFVTQRPNNSDAIHAQRFRRLLMQADRCTGGTASGHYHPASAAIQLRTRCDAASTSPFIRNSRLSTVVDPMHTASIGSRMDYEAFGRMYLREDPANTLVLLNTSVSAIQREFKQLAAKYGCRLHVESLI